MCRKCGMISLLRCSVVWWMVQLILTGDIVISWSSASCGCECLAPTQPRVSPLVDLLHPESVAGTGIPETEREHQLRGCNDLRCV